MVVGASLWSDLSGGDCSRSGEAMVGQRNETEECWAGQKGRDGGGQDKHDKETGKERLVMQRIWEGEEGSQHSGKNCGPRGESV